MFTSTEIGAWIDANLLDSDAWDRSEKQAVAVIQAERNLGRWYPDETLSVDVVSFQTIWELQGVDPALKFQKHNVKAVTDEGEQVSYKDGMRDIVAPDVRDLLGSTAEEIAAESSTALQYGGCLI